MRLAIKVDIDKDLGVHLTTSVPTRWYGLCPARTADALRQMLFLKFEAYGIGTGVGEASEPVGKA